MKKLSITCFLMMFTLSNMNAQSMNKNVVSNSGHHMENTVGTINFTIGEPLIGLVNNGSSIDQGFWSGTLQVQIIKEDKGMEGIFVYPNPVEDVLTIFSNGKKVYGATVFSVNGQRVLKQKVDASQVEHTIDFSHIANGTYVLQLFIENEKREKLFKIIKK